VVKVVGGFLKELSEAYTSLNAKRFMDLMYFPNTDEGNLDKETMTKAMEAEFKISRMIEAKVVFKIEPAKDKNAIIEDENEVVIRKGTIIQKTTFDPELVKSLIKKETDLEVLKMLGYILAHNPDGIFEKSSIISEDIDAAVSPIQLKRVDKRWKMVAF